MLDSEMEECLEQLAFRRGEKRTSRAHGSEYFKIPIKDRRRLLVLFVRWMKMRGVELEKFKKSSFEKMWLYICFGNAPVFDPKKRENGHDACKKELKSVLANEAKDIYDGKRRRGNKNAKPVAPQDLQFTPRSPFTPPEEEPEDKPVGRPVNRALYANVSGHKAIVDEEFLALIKEVKDNE